MSSRSSNYKIKRCPSSITTDCIEVTWVAEEDISCLGICNGNTLSEAQVAIVDKICELVGDIDISTLIIPSCFTTAFSTGNPSILEVLNTMLNTACVQQEQIADLSATSLTLSTHFTVNYDDYPCCADTCGTLSFLTISEHFNKILQCICNLSSKVTALEAQVGDINNTAYSSFESAVNDLNERITILTNQATTNFTRITTAVNCLVSESDGVCTPIILI